MKNLFLISIRAREMKRGFFNLSPLIGEFRGEMSFFFFEKAKNRPILFLAEFCKRNAHPNPVSPIFFTSIDKIS